MPKRFSEMEFATLAKSPYNTSGIPVFGGKLRLTTQDLLMIEQGGGGSRAFELYQNLLVDPTVYAAMDQQLSEITSRPLQIRAVSDKKSDKKFANSVLQQLQVLGKHQDLDSDKQGNAVLSATYGIDHLTRSLGLACLQGLRVSEIIWFYNKRTKRIEPREVKTKDERRFMFLMDVDTGVVQPRLLLNTNSWDGVPLPARKFIFGRYWAMPNEDEYGAGIGRYLYWPVQWKRQLLTYWLSWVDKYTSPTAIGTYPMATVEAELDDFESAVRNIAQESGIVMPEGYSLSFLKADGAGANSFETLLKVCDAMISMVIRGENTTGQFGVGSGMRDNISNSLRVVKAKMVSDSVDDTLNSSLIPWMTYYQAPKGVLSPSIYRNFEIELDDSQLLQYLKQMSDAGFDVDRKFLSEKTGITFQDPAEVQSEQADPLAGNDLDPPSLDDMPPDANESLPETEATPPIESGADAANVAADAEEPPDV